MRGNSNAQLVFVYLLAHSDKDGLVNIVPARIAGDTGMALADVLRTLVELENEDDESRTPDEGGRRIVRLDAHRTWGWQIVNHARYRDIRREEDRRIQNRDAKRREREKSALVSIGQHKSALSANTETDTEAETEEEATEKTASSSLRSEEARRSANVSKARDIVQGIAVHKSVTKRDGSEDERPRLWEIAKANASPENSAGELMAACAWLWKNVTHDFAVIEQAIAKARTAKNLFAYLQRDGPAVYATVGEVAVARGEAERHLNADADRAFLGAARELETTSREDGRDASSEEQG